MRSVWAIALVVLASMLLTITLSERADAVEATLEDDVYLISVDPDDPDQGRLEIHGEVDPGSLGLGQTVSVSLSVVVHEVKADEPTGRQWHAEIFYDDSSLGTGSKLFGRNDGPEQFTVRIDPSDFNPDIDDTIPVPPGLAEDVEGRMIVTATFTGTGVPSGETIAKATIYPELYHLINLSTPDADVRMEAGDRLIYSLSIKNAGNMIETIDLEIPVLEDLEKIEFTTDLEKDRFVDIVPGMTVNSTLSIKAPLEIKKDDIYNLVIKAHTEAEDPITTEPASYREIRIKIELIKSKIEKPPPTDSDTDTDNDPNDDDPIIIPPGPGQDLPSTDGTSNPWVVVAVIAFIVAIILILAFIFFRRSGGEGGDDHDDPHASMVRI